MVQEIIYGLDGDGFPTLSDFEIEQGDNIRLLEAFFVRKPDINLLKKRLYDILPSLNLSINDIMLTEIKEKDWISESQKLLQPVDAGLFFIHGRHDADKIPADKISLLVEAGQAFGTGQHETTHCCLLAIGELAEELTDDRTPETVLDLGCGSGLLALAMNCVWPIRVVASDIDPIATDTTILNAKANQIPVVTLHSGMPGIAALTCDGFEDNGLVSAGPYNVIVANILAKPLQDMAPDIVANLSRGGTLILSGLLNTQEGAVGSAYTKQGMKLIKRFVRGEWHCLMLRHEQ